MIPLSKPFIEEDDIDGVVDVFRSGRLSIGPVIDELEKKFARYIGVKYAVAVNSGTSALHLAIKALGIGFGDEVIVTPFSFVASANCVLFEGAVPVFVDIEPVTFNIDPSKIEEKITYKTKAIIAVDVFGRPCDKEAIMSIAKKHNLFVIEDSAEALGAEYNRKKVGSFGDVGIFAFYPNKQLCMAEAGILVTNNKEIYDLARSYRNQGRGDGDDWHNHIRIGYNYRLSEIHAALGVTQLRKVDRILKMRKRVAIEYSKRLSKVVGVKLPFFSDDVSWFVYVIQVDEKIRVDFMKRLQERGVSCSDYFKPIHLMNHYREMGFKDGDFLVCEQVSKTTVALPFYTGMSIKEVDFVCDQVKFVLEELL